MKRCVVRLVFFFLGRALCVLGRADSRCCREVAGWPEGFWIALQAGRGVSLHLEKRGGRLLRQRDTAAAGAEGVAITFKCMEAAFQLAAARLSIHDAQAQHRFTLAGDIGRAMGVVRCMALAERYLFPGFLARRVLRRMEEKERSSLYIYAQALFLGR